MNQRTKETAIENAKSLDPIALHRMVTAHEQLLTSREEVTAQSARRAEAAAQLAEAGLGYRDIARILDTSAERARQLVAKHYGVAVGELNPRATQTTARH